MKWLLTIFMLIVVPVVQAEDGRVEEWRGTVQGKKYLAVRGAIENGHRVGVWEEFNEDGKLTYKAVYQDFKR